MSKSKVGVAGLTLAAALLLVTGCGGGKKDTLALEGWAIAGHPLVGATIEALDANGKVVATSPEKTLSTGTWYLPLDKPPAHMTIVARGGTDAGRPFTGTLRDVVIGYDHRAPHTIHVNPATTLVSGYLAKHPEASPERGVNAVRKFLGVPSTSNLESNLRASDTYFSGAHFMSQAEAAGGIGPFVGSLVRELDAGKSHAFRPPDAPTRTVQAATADSLGGVVAAVSTVSPLQVLQGVSSTLSIVSGIVSLIRGGQQQAAIQAIDGQLTTIEGQVADLGGLVDQLAALDNKHQYTNAISSTTRGLETQLAIVYPLYQQILQDAGGSTAQINAAISNFENAIYIPNGTDYRDTWRGGSSGGGVDGIYSDLVGQGGADGALQAWSDYAGTSATRFISTATQTRAAQALAYWVNVQTEVLAVDAAYEDAINTGTVTTTTTGTTTAATTTNANPVSMGTAQDAASFGGANAAAVAAQCQPSGGTTSSANLLLNEYNASHACFQQLGSATSVWVDQATNLMWEYNGNFSASPFTFAAANAATTSQWDWPAVAAPNWQRPSIGQLQTLGSLNQGTWNVSGQYTSPLDMLVRYAQVDVFQGIFNVSQIPGTAQPNDYTTAFWSSTSGDCAHNYQARPPEAFCYQQAYDFLNGNTPWMCVDPSQTDQYGCSATSDQDNAGQAGNLPAGYFKGTHQWDWADWVYERTVPASEGPYGGG